MLLNTLNRNKTIIMIPLNSVVFLMLTSVTDVPLESVAVRTLPPFTAMWDQKNTWKLHIKILKNIYIYIYRRVTGPCVTVPAKYHHDHNRCHYEEERCAAHHWPDQQWQSILDLLRVFLCGREVSKPSAVAANKNTPVADYRVKSVISFLQTVAPVGRLDTELWFQPLRFLESCWGEINWIFLMK